MSFFDTPEMRSAMALARSEQRLRDAVQVFLIECAGRFGGRWGLAPIIKEDALTGRTLMVVRAPWGEQEVEVPVLWDSIVEFTGKLHANLRAAMTVEDRADAEAGDCWLALMERTTHRNSDT